jgi:hypothetical protein
MNESSKVEKATKKAYAAPSLVLYGSIAKLTLGFSGSLVDGQCSTSRTQGNPNNCKP